MYKYDLGIIGGMGSEATVELYKRIIDRTYHTCDQEHMRICVLNNSIIPDRTKCIISGGENPLPYLNESIKDLENIKAKYFIIPCNTAHYFANGFKYEKISFINMIEETLDYIHENYNNKKVCILATHGTINSKVYHGNSKANGLSFVYANKIEQEEIMQVITDTKSDVDRKIILNNFMKTIESISKREGGCLFVLACTELSLYLEEVKKEYLAIDAMDCLVNSAIVKCGYKLKK